MSLTAEQRGENVQESEGMLLGKIMMQVADRVRQRESTGLKYFTVQNLLSSVQPTIEFHGDPYFENNLIRVIVVNRVAEKIVLPTQTNLWNVFI